MAEIDIGKHEFRCTECGGSILAGLVQWAFIKAICDGLCDDCIEKRIALAKKETEHE